MTRVALEVTKQRYYRVQILQIHAGRVYIGDGKVMYRGVLVLTADGIEVLKNNSNVVFSILGEVDG